MGNLVRSKSTSLTEEGDFTAGLSQEKLTNRDLYLCYQRNEAKSDVSVVYANVGLACLAMRRLLQVSFLFALGNNSGTHLKCRVG